MFIMYAAPDVEHYCLHLAKTHPKFKIHRENWYLDDEAKRAIAKVSNSVVALVSCTGNGIYLCIDSQVFILQYHHFDCLIKSLS